MSWESFLNILHVPFFKLKTHKRKFFYSIAIDRELRNLASMPITEEVLDELVGEKKETPTHGGGAKDKETAKEGKHEKGHVAKNIMEASKASKEKVIKAAGKAKMNIRKRIDSERDPERQNSRGQLIKDKAAAAADRDGVGGAGTKSNRIKSDLKIGSL